MNIVNTLFNIRTKQLGYIDFIQFDNVFVIL